MIPILDTDTDTHTDTDTDTDAHTDKQKQTKFAYGIPLVPITTREIRTQEGG